MNATTQVYSVILPYVRALFEKIVDRYTPIRRLGLTFSPIVSNGWEGYDLFTDVEAVEREKTLEHTVIGIKDKFGKNAMPSPAVSPAPSTPSTSPSPSPPATATLPIIPTTRAATAR